MVIPEAGGLFSADGGHGRGGGPAGGHSGVPTGGRGGISTGGRGGGPDGGSDPAPAPDKGKQACVILDNDEVSSDEDEPLQKLLQWLPGAGGPSRSGPGPAVPYEAIAMAAAADMEATNKRVTVTRAAEEVMEKVAADKEAAIRGL
jgi:hypothetical protein